MSIFRTHGNNRLKGFTLIELLVVISIISLFSSLIISNIVKASDSAKDSVIIQLVADYRKLLELERQDTGTYRGLYQGYEFDIVANGPERCWWNLNYSTGNTRLGFPAVVSKYMSPAQKVCEQIATLSRSREATNSYYLYIFGVWGSSPKSVYSIAVWLPGIKKYYCINEEGKTSFTSVLATANDVGCLFYTN